MDKDAFASGILAPARHIDHVVHVGCSVDRGRWRARGKYLDRAVERFVSHSLLGPGALAIVWSSARHDGGLKAELRTEIARQRHSTLPAHTGRVLEYSYRAARFSIGSNPGLLVEKIPIRGEKFQEPRWILSRCRQARVNSPA